MAEVADALVSKTYGVKTSCGFDSHPRHTFKMILILVIILCLIVVLFAFPQFSPVPYFPANKRDVKLILKTLRLRNNQVVVDLGAGDGVVIFEAAEESKRKRLNTQFVAVEINPILIFVLHLRRFSHSNRTNIMIIWDDYFKVNLSTFSTRDKSVTIFVYLSPWFLEDLMKKIRGDLKRFEMVSYFYPLPKTVPPGKVKKRKNINAIYKYTYA